MSCDGNLGATRNWCSLNASLKRSHAIPDGLKLFRTLSVMPTGRYGLACALHSSLQSQGLLLVLSYAFLFNAKVARDFPDYNMHFFGCLLFKDTFNRIHIKNQAEITLSTWFRIICFPIITNLLTIS